uniref:Uncharacterized protein n=1 Tax=Sipha flava TaxID=143950 RepID=A0A2S2QYP4_9HEMI
MLNNTKTTKNNWTNKKYVMLFRSVLCSIERNATSLDRRHATEYDLYKVIMGEATYYIPLKHRTRVGLTVHRRPHAVCGRASSALDGTRRAHLLANYRLLSRARSGKQ